MLPGKARVTRVTTTVLALSLVTTVGPAAAAAPAQAAVTAAPAAAHAATAATSVKPAAAAKQAKKALAKAESTAAKAAKAAKQAKRALAKAESAAAKAAKAAKQASAARKKQKETLARARVSVLGAGAGLDRARAESTVIGTQVALAADVTESLRRDEGMLDVVAQATEVASGDSESSVLTAAGGLLKAGLTGVVGPALAVLDPVGDAVEERLEDADQVVTAAKQREARLREAAMDASNAHRAASIAVRAAESAEAGARAALRKARTSEDVTFEEKAAATESAKVAAAANEKATTALRAARAEVKAMAKAEAKARDQAEAAALREAGLPSRSVGALGRVVRPATGSITSRYGMRRHPITGVYKLHTGTDFQNGDGQAYATTAGTVAAVTYDGAYGNMVTLTHGSGLQTRYAHLSRAVVSNGQQVRAGQVIGRIGSTGYSTGPHLHFEVLRGGEFVNPEPWLGF